MKQAAVLMILTVLCIQSAIARFGTDWPDILEASFQGDLDRVNFLLAQGAKVNVRVADGTTPLLVAAARGHQAIVTTLLEKGADINTQNNEGWSALMLATRQRHIQIVKVLLKAGADIQLKNKQGKTAEIIAKSVGLSDLYKSQLAKSQRPQTESPSHLIPQARKGDTPKEPEIVKSNQRVKSLLRLAGEQMDDYHLTSPQGANAYDTYRQILDIDPSNTAAKDGIKRIASLYERLARQAKESHDYKRGLANAEKGLTVQQDHTGLKTLHQELEALVIEKKQAEEKESQEKSRYLKREREIADLLSQAEQQLSAKNLTTPAGNNALATYQKIMEMDPENHNAINGIIRIAQAYEKLAQREWDKGRYELSLEYIERGLNVSGQYSPLIKLRTIVIGKIEEQAKIKQERENKLQKINNLLADAEVQLDKGQLTEPDENNAWKTFKDVLKLDPDNTQALQGIERIGKNYLVLSQQSMESGNLEKSQAYITKGLMVLPNNRQLLAQRDNAQLALEEKQRQRLENKRRSHKINELLEQAVQQMKSKQFTEPKDYNAWLSYQKVLELDPTNVTAQSGLEELAKAYIKLSRNSLQAEQLTQATAYATTGLKIDPDNKDLQSLQVEINRKLIERKRIQAEEAERQRTLSQLVKRAERQLSELQLTSPEGDNAFETYHEIKEIDPGNSDAEDILSKISDNYLNIAKNAVKHSDYEMALQYIEKGLFVTPKDLALTKLHQDILLNIEKIERQRAEKQIQQEISRLLSKAESQFAASKLVNPTNDNAFESYQRILQLDSTNKHAKDGLLEIKKEYKRIGRSIFEQGDLTKSLAYAQSGLRVFPGDQDLIALRNESQIKLQELEQRRISEELKSRRIKDLLKQAEEHLRAQRLIKPPKNNAYDSYRSIIQIDPNNEEALAGLAAIANEYYRKSVDSMERQKYAESLELAQQGLKIVNDDERLVAIENQARKKLQDEKNKQELILKKEQKIQRLLIMAQDQYDKGKLTEPADNNALDSFKEVIKLDPENIEAARGIRSIAEKYLSMSQKSMDAGDLDLSMKYALRGLEITPDQQQLLSLRDKITMKIDERKQQELDKAKKHQQVIRLLDVAQQQFNQSKFIEPDNDNALATYQKVLMIEPDNKGAIEGLRKIVEEYKRLAENSIDKGRLVESMMYISTGLKVIPNDRTLLVLRNQVQQKQKKAELDKRVKEMERQKELARLMADVRAKESVFQRMERKLDAEEQALKLSIQHVLVRQWGYPRDNSAE